MGRKSVRASIEDYFCSERGSCFGGRVELAEGVGAGCLGGDDGRVDAEAVAVPGVEVGVTDGTDGGAVGSCDAVSVVDSSTGAAVVVSGEGVSVGEESAVTWAVGCDEKM